MKISANEIRIGNVLEHNNKLWIVTKTQHVQPGKGGAYIQAEMKELRGGSKLNERFRSAEAVEKVFLDEKPFQYLYQDGEYLHFMDQSTYDQIQLPIDLVGDSSAFLSDGMVVTICLYENEPISVTVQQTVIV